MDDDLFIAECEYEDAKEQAEENKRHYCTSCEDYADELMMPCCESEEFDGGNSDNICEKCYWAKYSNCACIGPNPFKKEIENGGE